MAIPTTVDMVRDLLIGADQSVFDDAYIQRQIDNGMNAIDIAIMIAESSASLYATKQDLKVGPISLSNSQKAQAWMDIKKNLIYRKNLGAGLPPDGSASSGGLVTVGGGVQTGPSRRVHGTDGEPSPPPCRSCATRAALPRRGEPSLGRFRTSAPCEPQRVSASQARSASVR